ncbi:uncharacterized protein N7515_006887 [Penicillium bovifimosum]|uniref:J domain-containing protein n=1 Tax=Penicillium bovifimosum TaxID=126998 RepID=A0A9W9L061_9EURO|nr:uncharacterized protein N7515_006887 [Penicillium bovifimosum]KAJ5130848.1 hypothetical protein N7515_006887 [Penicillium bovifimosum]
MTLPPDLDPYATLGVAKEATLTEIRAAHRKRVLKCHPDKIQDESQRRAAQDEFQQVQQAYELLSDETQRAKYDQTVKIAELKRELLERRRTDPSYGSPRGSGNGTREFRNGHIVEERVPLDVYFEEKMRFTEEPRSVSRKYDEFGLRSKPKATEEKKKTRTPLSTYRQAKERKESVKATHSDRAKTRDQERRRQAEAKHDTFEPYLESDEEASDSSVPRRVYTRISTTPRRERDSRSRPLESSRRRERRYEEESDLSDHWQSKIDSQSFSAEDYIASKTGRSSKSPRRYHGYDSTEPESAGARSSARYTRTRHRSSSRDDSYEHLETPRAYETKPPKMQSSVTSPSIKASFRPPFLTSRSATATGYTRPKQGHSSTLYQMMYEEVPSRTSKTRDRNDSGYSSPGTPEMLPRGSSPKISNTRYKIVEEPDHIVVEPKSSKYRTARSPDRERPTPTRQPPKRSSTYQTYTEASPRAETRSARTTRTQPDVEYISRPKEKDIKYSRTYKPEDVSYSPRPRAYYCEDDYRPPVGRRQSAY